MDRAALLWLQAVAAHDVLFDYRIGSLTERNRALGRASPEPHRYKHIKAVVSDGAQNFPGSLSLNYRIKCGSCRAFLKLLIIKDFCHWTRGICMPAWG